MRWTRTPPSKPGRYLCRFLESTGVGIEPFEIEVVEDTINGGIAFLDRQGICHTLTGADAPRCEWALRRPLLLELVKYSFAALVVVFTFAALGFVIWQIGRELAGVMEPGVLVATGLLCMISACPAHLRSRGERGTWAVRPVWFIRLGVVLVIAAGVWALIT